MTLAIPIRFSTPPYSPVINKQTDNIKHHQITNEQINTFQYNHIKTYQKTNLETLFSNVNFNILKHGMQIGRLVRTNPQIVDFCSSVVYKLMKTPRLEVNHSGFLSKLEYFEINQQHIEHGKFIQYMTHVLSSTNVTSSALLLSLFYIYRLKSRITKTQSKYNVNSHYRVWLTALMLADVYLNDNAFTTKSWSLVGGMKVEDCVVMKKEFLSAITWDLSLDESEWFKWLEVCESLSSQI